MRFRLGSFLVFIGLLVLSACIKKSNSLRVSENIITIETDTISYDQCGSGDTTLLFIHGWCINKSYWQPQFDFFCKNYTVIALDLPGFGKSSKHRIDYSFDKYVDDIHRFIEKLQFKNVYAIGHSMSGDIVLGLAAKYPQSVSAIIGIDNLHEPTAMKDSAQRKEEAAFYDYFESNYDTVAQNTASTYLFSKSTPDTIRNRVMQNILSTNPSLSINVLRNLAAIQQEQKLRMQALQLPLKLVNSDVFPVRIDSLHQYCKMGVQVELVPGTGHYPMVESPQLFNEALSRIIRK